MKAYRANVRMAPLILKLDTKVVIQFSVLAALSLWKEPLFQLKNK